MRIKYRTLTLIFLPWAQYAAAITLCARMLEEARRNLHLSVDYNQSDGKLKALIIELSNHDDPVRSMMTGVVSSDGKTFTSHVRVTANEDQNRGFQRILSNEIAKHFPNIEHYSVSLIEENGIALMQAALGIITNKPAFNFISKDGFGLDLAKKLHLKLSTKSEAEKFDILSRAAQVTPDFRLAKRMMGEAAVKAADLEILPGGFYRLRLEIDKVPAK